MERDPMLQLFEDMEDTINQWIDSFGNTDPTMTDVEELCGMLRDLARHYKLKEVE